jgi:hypothetical protein
MKSSFQGVIIAIHPATSSVECPPLLAAWLNADPRNSLNGSADGNHPAVGRRYFSLCIASIFMIALS